MRQKPKVTLISTAIGLTALLLVFLDVFGNATGSVVEIGGHIYQTVYQTENFQIREAYLGQKENFWENFSMPERIDKPVHDLGIDEYGDIFGGQEKIAQCETQLKSTGWCTDRIVIKNPPATENIYEWGIDRIGVGGHYILKKNNIKIWEGDLFGAIIGPVLSSKVIGDEIAIEYCNVLPNSNGKVIESILLTNNMSVIDMVKASKYDAVFAPNEIEGKLIYFAKNYGEVINNQTLVKYYLVFSGNQVGEYDHVFNQYCCWDGPPIQIIGNGKAIDFFARRGDAWYHVQAGNLTSPK